MNGFNKRYLILILLIFLAFLSISQITNVLLYLAIFVLSLIILLLIFHKLGFGKKNVRTLLILLMISSVLGSSIGGISSAISQRTVEKYSGERVIEGYVIEISSSYPYMSESVVRIESVDGEKASFDAILVTEFASDLSLGDKLECKVDLMGINAYDDAALLKNGDLRDAYIVCVANDEDSLEIKGSKSNLRLTLLSLNSRISATLKAILGSKNGALASALLLGNREALGDAEMRDFKRAGAYHMLALSGLHVAILIGIVDYILKKLLLDKRIRIAILVALVISYIALTGFKLSACRAAVMLLILYLSTISRSRNDALTSLFVSVSVICAISPVSVFDLGLQLSFLSTFGVIASSTVCSKIAFFVPSDTDKIFKKALKYLLSSAIASICVFTFTLPLIMKYFAEVSLATLFTNLFMGLVCEAFMVLALLSLLLYKILFVGSFVTYLAGLMGNIMGFTVSVISSIEGVMLSLSYPNIEYIVWGLFAISLVLFAIKLKRRWIIAIPSVAFCLLLCVNVLFYNASREGSVRVEYLKGDGIVLSSSEGVYLCDASNGRYGNLYDGAALAKENCFTEIDGIVLTHYHSYHAISLDRMTDDFIVHEVYLPTPQNENELMHMSAIALALENKNIGVYVYDSGTSLDILGGSLYISERAYSADYSHPSVAFSYLFGNSRVTVLENPYFDTILEKSYVISDLISQSDVVIFGSDGRKYNSRFEVFYRLKKGAEIVFADREAVLLSDVEAYLDDFKVYVDSEYKKYDLK